MPQNDDGGGSEDSRREPNSGAAQWEPLANGEEQYEKTASCQDARDQAYSIRRGPEAENRSPDRRA
jgi:hypothetical protein